MTIKIELECDASNCCASVEIEDNLMSDVEKSGWHTHPYDGYQHYCPKCWPTVEKEIKDEG